MFRLGDPNNECLDYKQKIFWKFVGAFGTDELFISSRAIWEDIICDIEKHETHSKEYSCGGCGRSYCGHLLHYCVKKFNVCCMCDTHHKPKISNPINLRFVKRYCPSMLHLIHRDWSELTHHLQPAWKRRYIKGLFVLQKYGYIPVPKDVLKVIISELLNY